MYKIQTSDGELIINDDNTLTFDSDKGVTLTKQETIAVFYAMASKLNVEIKPKIRLD
jgi:hypothetical protein